MKFKTTTCTVIAMAFIFIGWVANPAGAAEPSMLIRAKTVYTGTGQPMSPGAVLVVGGEISLVSESINVDDSIPVVEVDTLLPGLVDAYASVRSESESSERTREVTPNFNALTGVNFRSRQFKEMLDEGVTTAHLMPGTDCVFAGTSAVIKTVITEDGQPEILNDRQALVLVVAADPSRGNRSRSRPDSIYVRQPTNRMGVIWIARKEFQKAIAGGDDLSANTTAIAEATSGDLPLYTISRTEVDITSTMTLAADFEYPTVVFGAAEAYRLKDKLAETKTPVVITSIPTGADARSLRGPEGTELRWYTLNQLRDADVQFAIAGGDLIAKARLAVRYGLSVEDAVSAITTTPAEILGISNSVGTIAPGKSADLIGLSDGLMSLASSVELRMINGQKVDSE